MEHLDILNLSSAIQNQNLLDCYSTLPVMSYYAHNGKLQIQIKDNILYRHFTGSPSHTGYAFPLALNNTDSNYLKTALLHIAKISSQNNTHISFCLITEDQKNQLDQIINECSQFDGMRINWYTNRDDSEYLYLQKNLVELKGDILQKKKNHVTKFFRTYENRWTFKTFPQNQIKEDIIKIAEQWLFEKGESIPELQTEFKNIQSLLNHPDLFKISGAVLYIDEKPAAMTIASPISPSVFDIHFEKAVGDAAKNGAYAVINNLFAKAHPEFKYFNREEDLGIPGLRKAKLSYKPEIILHKFYGVLE